MLCLINLVTFFFPKLALWMACDYCEPNWSLIYMCKMRIYYLFNDIDLGWGYAIIIIWKDNNNLRVKRKPNERRQRGLKLEFRKMEWKVVREREEIHYTKAYWEHKKRVYYHLRVKHVSRVWWGPETLITFLLQIFLLNHGRSRSRW